MSLIMMKGLPGSGKSTLARQMVGNGKTCIRVNRDDIRSMLYGHNYNFSKNKEDLVIRAERSIAQYALAEKCNCIIDDTNLSAKNKILWSEVARDYSSEFKVVDLTKTVTVDECINRDYLRTSGRVGRAVIERMALFNNLLPDLDPKRKKIVIFDIDGTLANGEHRLPCITEGKSDWKTYKELAIKDTINLPIADWLREIQKTTTVFIASGRGTDEAIITEDWLRNYNIVPDRLFMRQGGDYTKDFIIKEQILQKILERYGNNVIDFVVDDRPVVIDMWRKNRIKVYPVNQESWEGYE
jgi:predicted kinase